MSETAETTEVRDITPHETDDPATGVPMHGLAAAPQIKASDLTHRLAIIREAMTDAMVNNVDYGVVPGTDKPTLLKPGSEKLGVLFQLDIQLDNEKLWGPGEHLTVISRAIAYHAPTGTRLGYGEGMCSTREKKYAYRKAERACPQCGVQAIIKGKAEYGGGWLCWKKKGGCGAKFADGSAEIESQAQGDVENPDLPDCWNTVIKMSEKRARVDCVLAVTGASALFTQDVEDLPEFQQAAEERRDQSQPQEPQQQTISSEQVAEIEGLLERALEAGYESGPFFQWMRENLGVSNIEDLSHAGYERALAALKKKLPASKKKASAKKAAAKEGE